MIYIVAGVSGSGKTTIGQLLGEVLNMPFYDADDYHSDENIDKLASGLALTDEDRLPWLKTLASEIEKWNQGKGGVFSMLGIKRILSSNSYLFTCGSNKMDFLER